MKLRNEEGRRKLRHCVSFIIFLTKLTDMSSQRRFLPGRVRYFAGGEKRGQARNRQNPTACGREKGDSQKNFGFFYLMAPKMRERKRKKNLSEAADN